MGVSFCNLQKVEGSVIEVKYILDQTSQRKRKPTGCGLGWGCDAEEKRREEGYRYLV